MTHDLSETGQDTGPDTGRDTGRGEQVQAEVELCTTLLIAATGTDRSFTQSEVDRLLGVSGASR